MMTKRFVPRPQVVYRVENATHHRAFVGGHIAAPHGGNERVSSPLIAGSLVTTSFPFTPSS